MQYSNLKKGYTIAAHRLNQYGKHYSIPSLDCLVVPLKIYEDEVCCDVHWEDANGELQVKKGLFFKSDNLRPLDAMNNFKLQELWSHFYEENSTLTNAMPAI